MFLQGLENWMKYTPLAGGLEYAMVEWPEDLLYAWLKKQAGSQPVAVAATQASMMTQFVIL